MGRAQEKPGVGPASRPWGEKVFTLFLVLACLVLAILVALLARENRRLKVELAAASPVAAAEAWKPGDRLEPLALVNGEGATEALNFGRGESRTLLLLFSPGCPACEAIYPLWEFLVDGAPSTLRVVGVSIGQDSPPSLSFPVFTLPAASQESLRRVPLVPSTLLIDDDGRIVRAWYGVLDTEDEEALLDELSPASLSSG